MSKKDKSIEKIEDEKFPLPEYPARDDIYNKSEEAPLEEDEITGKITTVPQKTTMDMNLDVPGAEADDNDEQIGEEDEENNYYSLGGDNHENLEEDREG